MGGDMDQMVQMLEQIPKLSTAEKASLIAQAPPEFDKLAKAAAELSAGEVKALANVAQAVQGGQAAPAIADIQAVCATFKSLPAEAKAQALAPLPADARPIAEGVAELPAEDVQNLATGAITLQKASLQEGDKTPIEMIEPLQAAKMHTALRHLPPKSKQAVCKKLGESAPGAEALMQVAEGLNEADVATLVRTFQTSQKPKDPNMSEENRQAEQRKMMAAISKTLALAEARRVRDWVRQGPKSLRVLCFVAGCLLIVGVAIQLFPDIVAPSRFVLDIYLLLFGVVIVAIEVESMVCSKYCARNIERMCGFLTTVYGRGVFYVVVGVMSLCHLWILPMKVAGLALLVLGFVCICVGRRASSKLEALRNEVHNEEEVRLRFKEADLDGSGELDLQELSALAKTLGSPLSHHELESAMRTLDANRNGLISLEEFLGWWQSKPLQKSSIQAQHARTMIGLQAHSHNGNDEPGAVISTGKGSVGIAAIRATVGTMRRGPKSLVFLTFVGGLALACLAGRQCLATDFSSMLFIHHALINLILCVFGVLIAVLEARGSCSQTMLARIERGCLLLALGWGRGCFYLFVGVLALAQPSMLLSLAGLYLAVVAVACIYIGRRSASKLNSIRDRLVDEAAVKKHFHDADADNSGELDSAELLKLSETLGNKLTYRELEVALVELDGNNNGTISFEEFLVWWKRKSFEDVLQAAEANAGAAQAPPVADVPGGSFL